MAAWDEVAAVYGPLVFRMAQQLLSPPSHPEMLGRIGRYEVERLIGVGGMGVVFKAFDTELKNVRAADAEQIVEQLYVGTGREAIALSVAVEQRTNSIIVRGDAAFFSEIEALLLRLDSETPRVDRDAKVWVEGNVEYRKSFSDSIPALEEGSDSRNFSEPSWPSSLSALREFNSQSKCATALAADHRPAS